MAKSLNRSRTKSAPSVLLIYTGGTIGMVQDFDTGVLKPINFEQIREEVPEIKKFNYKIDVVSFHPVIDSSNMSSDHWIRIAEIIKKHYDQYTGFVILHGSDTLAYTASALSFMLENLSKPVILTGSQLPVGEVRTDAKENLITAIEIAAGNENNRAVVPEVCIYFDYLLFRGNRTVKLSSSKFEAFRSENYPSLAEAGVHISYNKRFILPLPTKKLKVHTSLDCRIGLVRIFPGMTKEWFSAQMNTKNIRAIVLETFGSGNAPSAKWFTGEIQKAIKKGVLVVNVTQCLSGRVEQGVYDTSATMAAIGVIGGSDLTTEAAITKLMFLLGSKRKLADIKQLMTTSLRGEMA